MKRLFLRRILSGLSFTSALFIFQACYGTPADFGFDVRIDGTIKAKSSGLPVKGIKVSTPATNQYTTTDDSGRFIMYTEMADSLEIRFEDIDNNQNGLFQNYDTILKNPQTQISLAVLLKDK
jgi:hypothetical protein